MIEVLKFPIMAVKVVVSLLYEVATDADAFLLTLFCVGLALLTSALVGITVFVGAWYLSRMTSFYVQRLARVRGNGR